MKRRAAESGKLRRPVKRTKIAEGVYGNSMLYLKFVMLWAAVVTADYMLEFRFEFLWPFWMMLRSVYDSFKYQGLAFSVFFICIALTSDMICFFFIPVQWVFLAASTYVWVQYVWYTVSCLDKGICLPTVVLCCALVYVEGALRGVRERGGGLGGGGLDLCRPFAAHCVGYPVVTLGFGVKSYVGHRMRLRRQREIQAENEFYYQLLRQALPEPGTEQPPVKEEKSCAANGSIEKPAEPHMNGHVKCKSSKRENGSCVHDGDKSSGKEKPPPSSGGKEKEVKTTHITSNGVVPSGVDEKPEDTHDQHTPPDKNKGNTKSSSAKEKKDKEVSVQKEEKSVQKEEKKKHKKEKEKEKEVAEKVCEQTKENITKEKESPNPKEDKDKEKEREKEQREREKEVRLYSEELKKARAALTASKACEVELRRSLAAAAASERARRQEHAQLKQAHAELHSKVNSLTAWRATERATLERRLGEERQRRNSIERQLQARQHQTKTGDCGGEWCRSRRATADADAQQLRRELQRARDHAAALQRELADAKQQVSNLETRCREATSTPSSGDALQHQQLASALTMLKERATHLERSLSAETRIKLDLFSALGEAKRQLQISQSVITSKEKEIEELKAKTVQMLAVMPSGDALDSLRLPHLSPDRSANSCHDPDRRANSSHDLDRRANSSLDPNACVYTPKNACSDA